MECTKFQPVHVFLCVRSVSVPKTPEVKKDCGCVQLLWFLKDTADVQQPNVRLSAENEISAHIGNEKNGFKCKCWCGNGRHGEMCSCALFACASLRRLPLKCILSPSEVPMSLSHRRTRLLSNIPHFVAGVPTFLQSTSKNSLFQAKLVNLDKCLLFDSSHCGFRRLNPSRCVFATVEHLPPVSFWPVGRSHKNQRKKCEKKFRTLQKMEKAAFEPHCAKSPRTLSRVAQPCKKPNRITQTTSHSLLQVTDHPAC